MTDRIIVRCAICGKPKPNDSTWARPATCCGKEQWVGSVTFTDTPDGPVVHGDVEYELSADDARLDSAGVRGEGSETT